ncbi:MCE family protein [Aeromicrobium terrae]|uniref:MCE family protein n=1 Tax=Aeromicrobium terrae TaxID=2498846 RepID=A0A5C8NHX2_9ACTN|nr:MCE family protein [Aeromicrobium terrae]TXL60762.1 MCE family protein [Aeromicrobium terrae]
MKRRIVAMLSLALVLGGCGFDGIYDLPLPGNKVSEGDGFEVSADFADALNVVPRSSVMVGDVPVGQVVSVKRVGWHARVKMRIRDDVKLPDDAQATIRQTSLLGEKYVALSKPTDAEGKEVAGTGRLGQGDVIPMEDTGRNPEVEEVLGALSFVLTGGGIGQLQTITHELNEMMEGRTGKIKHVLTNVNTLVSTLNDQRNDIVQAMESINGLSATLVSEKDTIGKALDAVGPAVTALRNQHQDLVKTLSELDDLGVVGTRVVNATKDDLVAELQHLEPVLRKLADTGDELVPGTVAAASYPFSLEAGDAIHGDFANVVFKFQIKLTPISEGGLIPTTLPDLVRLCRATPLAPICSPAGDAIDKLCSVLKNIPLCDKHDVGTVESTLTDVQRDAGKSGASGPAPKPTDLLTPTPNSGNTSGGFVQRLISGLLGGGSS